MHTVTSHPKDGIPEPPNEVSTAKRGSSVSVIVAALNEEPHLEATVMTGLRAAKRHFARHEVLVFDDGSTDRTGAIADELAAAHPTVRAFHHVRPVGLGGVFWRGVDEARMSASSCSTAKTTPPKPPSTRSSRCATPPTW